MRRRKLLPEERAARFAAKLKAKAEAPSSWPGFDAFWQSYPHPATSADTNLENLGKYAARIKWELQQPDTLVIAAILWKLRTDPGITVDQQTGKVMFAAGWLLNLWPAPPIVAKDLTAEIQAILDDAERPGVTRTSSQRDGITDGSHSQTPKAKAPPKVEEIERLPIGEAR